MIEVFLSSPGWLLAPIGIIGGGMLLQHEPKEKKILEELLRAVYIERYTPPQIKEFKKHNWGYETSLAVTPGTSTSALREKRKEVEQLLKGEMDVYFDEKDGMIHMEITTKQLGTEYDFTTIKASSPSKIVVGYGKKNMVEIDLAKFPFILIGGTPGSGKSSLIKSIITNIILGKKTYKDRIYMYLMDFKGTELGVFRDSSLVKDYCDNLEDAVFILRKLVKEMDKRNKILIEKGAESIDEYNKKYGHTFNREILIADEFADLSSLGKDSVEMELLHKLIRKGRSAGMHVILSTLRPTVDIIPGNLKALIEGRICLRVKSAMESKIVMDEEGGEEIRVPGRCIVKTDKMLICQPMFADNDTIRELIKHTYIDRQKYINNNNMDSSGEVVINDNDSARCGNN